jgi:hypothetical protein
VIQLSTSMTLGSRIKDYRAHLSKYNRNTSHDSNRRSVQDNDVSCILWPILHPRFLYVITICPIRTIAEFNFVLFS